MLAGLLVGFLGLPSLVLGLLIYSRRLVVRLEREGLHARGKVVRVRNPRSNKRSVDYAFRPPEGPELQGSFQEWPPPASEQTPGSPVDVLYLADAPRHHMAVGTGLSRRFFLFIATVLVLFASTGTLTALHEYFTRPEKARPSTTPAPP
ncbi:hypothetical protein D7Y13_13855 [Corallococcus praedator]|uniref:DUF3592 domain-containing protein n=2 Tax=Myxococcaceae TaxID=31 RepID=A0ABX9QJD2_9BACT|nr:hypothetical protein D7X74_33180 [Corallococcus sp. CA047B]RKH27445.1 hypothetical protein D7X75_26390 [Corallococcus sp. CA031C]RKI09781.1 hypothetical protein D7Y13_13855 [Corallococcus praedator]